MMTKKVFHKLPKLVSAAGLLALSSSFFLANAQTTPNSLTTPEVSNASENIPGVPGDTQFCASDAPTVPSDDPSLSSEPNLLSETSNQNSAECIDAVPHQSITGSIPIQAASTSASLDTPVAPASPSTNAIIQTTQTATVAAQTNQTVDTRTGVAPTAQADTDVVSTNAAASTANPTSTVRTSTARAEPVTISNVTADTSLPGGFSVEYTPAISQSNPVGLEGQAVFGAIEVEVSHADNIVDMVVLLNSASNQERSRSRFNLQRGSTALSRIIETGNLTDGQYALSIEVQFADGTTGSTVVTFNVANDANPFGLDPDLEPWENFDLSDWVIDTPAFASDGESERFGELRWDEISDESRAFFFTHTDGGMRFVTRLDGARTSENTSFTRSELREMLRAGKTSFRTQGVTGNNWALGYQPNNPGHGGRNGVLTATLRINKVTTTGFGIHVGRTIIGQIHADNDEPIRLYYRKEPNQERGCVYAEHEIRNGDDVEFSILGDEDCDNISNGIALDELFSYEITNENENIHVIIRRGDSDGPIIGETTIDMIQLNSGYDINTEWMYFKLGAYTQNNRGNGDDGDIITFYRLKNTHDSN